MNLNHFPLSTSTQKQISKIKANQNTFEKIFFNEKMLNTLNDGTFDLQYTKASFNQ